MIKIKFNLLQILTNEFTECQTPTKKLQSIGISPASSNAFMKTLKSDISKAYKVQVDCLSLILKIKILWKRKWMTWLGCTRQCKKNWKQHHIQNQSKFLPWYLINGLECTVQNILMPLNTLTELHIKSKSRWNISKTCSIKSKHEDLWNTFSGNKHL